MTIPAPATSLTVLIRHGVRDAVAGLVASIVLIANIVSFAALMFPGQLGAGIPVAIWAMLVGSCIGGVWIAWATSIPPLASGIDSPTGAVLVLLSATTATAVTAAGGTPAMAVHAVMLTFTVATFITAALLFALGVLRWGSYFRFVPYFVVGGFLAATGWFLVAGGIRMLAGTSSWSAGWTPTSAAKLASGVAVLLVILGVRRYVKSPLGMPLTIVVLAAAGSALLHGLDAAGPEHGWYLPSLGQLTPWTPFAAESGTTMSWSTIASLGPEVIAAAIVALISLVTKVATLEVARKCAGDLDREFRAHGVAGLAAAPCGGIMCSLQTGTSRLLEQAGGATRMSGVACALAMGVVGVAQINLPALVPIPIVAGLVFFLGYTFLVDALWKPFRQRARLDFVLTAGIMAVCVTRGFLMGVLVGLVGACVLFAISYARLGVVRRHVTRQHFSSYVSRSLEAAEYLRKRGEAIQLYWLSGYIFFGSSESLFERVRADSEARPSDSVRYVILDFAGVPGADSSAAASVVKLRNYADRRGLVLLFSAVRPALRQLLDRNGVFDGGRHRAFDDSDAALSWCEDQLLAAANLAGAPGVAAFEGWLQEQLGGDAAARDVMAYLMRKDLSGAAVVYAQGEPADTLDLVADGTLVIDIVGATGERVRVRHLATHAIVGEMGFFRRGARSATVSSHGPATLFTLTRSAFERMRADRPDLASAFSDFIVRTLADRIDFANVSLAALSRP